MSSADNLIKMLESGIFTTTRADSDRAQIALKMDKSHKCDLAVEKGTV